MHNIPDKKELDFADGYILHDIVAGGLVGVSALPIVSCILFMLAEGAAVIEFFIAITSAVLGGMIMKSTKKGSVWAGCLSTIVGFFIGILPACLIWDTYFVIRF